MPDTWTITITDTETGEVEVSEVFTPRSKVELRAYLSFALAQTVYAYGFGEAYIDNLNRDESGALVADVLAAHGEDNFDAPRGMARVSVDDLAFQELV